MAIGCEGAVPLGMAEISESLNNLPGWEIFEDKLEKTFRFPDFKQALGFVNKIGELAQKQSHHPDLELGWGRVKVSLITHAIKALSKEDIILAKNIDDVYVR
jgi:4a-hydroxytetrahydrobiopterin dehydratase